MVLANGILGSEPKIKNCRTEADKESLLSGSVDPDKKILIIFKKIKFSRARYSLWRTGGSLEAFCYHENSN
jgi:hypothetical protein